jgi:hypothetical protein
MNLHPKEELPGEGSVGVEKLDNLKEKASGADLVKIDVEGTEFQLIQGAIQTLKDTHPIIVIELLRKWMKPFGSTPQYIIDLLIALDYMCFAMGESSLQLVTVIDAPTL